jgi:hypothetical protein
MSARPRPLEHLLAGMGAQHRAGLLAERNDRALREWRVRWFLRFGHYPDAAAHARHIAGGIRWPITPSALPPEWRLAAGRCEPTAHQGAEELA